MYVFIDRLSILLYLRLLESWVISMDFEACFNTSSVILMEGAVVERLKREYNITFDEKIAMAGLVYNEYARQAIQNIFEEYVLIAEKYQLPFIMTTPTRRANKENVEQSGLNEKIIEDNVRFMQQIKSLAKTEMYVGGLMGCKGDAYKASDSFNRGIVISI